MLREALRRLPDDIGLNHDLARLLEARGDWDQALPLWRHAAARPEAPWWLHGAWGGALRQLGRLDEAEQVLARAQARYPDADGLLADRAHTAAARGDWATCEALWAAFRQRRPDDADAWSGLAGSKRQRENWTGLVAVLSDATSRFPDRAEFVVDLSRTLARLGETDRADHIARMALDRFPDASALRHDLARAAERRRDWDEAERHWRAIIAGSEPPPWAYLALADVLEQQRREADADALLRAGLDRLPGNEAIAIAYARLAERRVDAAEAGRRWSEVRQRFPDVAEGHLAVAGLQRRDGNVDAAETTISVGLARMPDHPRLLAEGARIAFSRGAFDLAAARWQDVCRLAPGDAVAAWQLSKAQRFAARDRALAGDRMARDALRRSAARTTGQRLMDVPMRADTLMEPRWFAHHAERFRAYAAQPPSHLQALGSVLTACMSSGHAQARRRLCHVLDAHEDSYPTEPGLFSVLLQGAALTSQWDIAEAILRDRYQSDWCARVGVCPDDLGPFSLRWQVDADRRSHFLLDRSIFEEPAFLDRWPDSMAMFHAYSTWADAEPGSIVFSFADQGTWPGLAPSDCRPDRFLIPDPQFLGSDGYARHRGLTWPNWVDRRPIAVWRGSAMRTARPGDQAPPLAPVHTQRVRLCSLAAEHSEVLDARLVGNYSFTAAEYAALEQAGLTGGFIPSDQFGLYKYQIDVDGISNAWSALFTKLLTGGVVLKVASAAGLKQWYYDDLLPWENFVPVAADLSDLLETLDWLRAHDEEAQRIGANGRALAQRMTMDSELARACRTIRTAMRHLSPTGAT